MTRARGVDVAIVGGGPTGAVLAARLAARGVEVVVLERAPRWKWYASGVFTSPAAVDALRRTGVPETTIDLVARPIPAMRLETRGGAVVRLEYGAEDGGPPAVGLDRSTLDPALIEFARTTGADVRQGVTVTSVEAGGVLGSTSRARVATISATGDGAVTARVLVGADGADSIVARTMGVARPVRLAQRMGLSFHVADGRRADVAVDARMCVVRDGYVGIAPVPGGRVNVGIVLGPTWRDELRTEGARSVVRRILGAVAPSADDPAGWQDRQACDPIAGTSPLGARVIRRSGPGWLLVGDAAGFLDPFTGEGLHRALISTELAAAAIVATLSGRTAAFDAYDRAMRRRFATKDVVSWIVQSFLSRPVAFEYAARRLAARPATRATMSRVMGDLVPASEALDPRFLARLLAP